MAFWWKNLSVTELLSLHGRGFALPRRFLSISLKLEGKVFQALPKQPEPLLTILLWNTPSPPGKGGLQTLNTSKALSQSWLCSRGAAGDGGKCPVPGGLWWKPSTGINL